MVEDRLIGRTIDGRYKIVELLGAGGVGAVYSAREISLDRLVALKVLHHLKSFDEETSLRFEREAAILASLFHPNIVVFYRYGICDDGTAYIATEYLKGRTLRSAIFEAESVIDWRRAATITMQICHALHAAHKLGIVHRDLKPENVMLLSDTDIEQVKVLDFGLAHVSPADGSAADQKLTKTGQLVGTVNYISPEQCQGKKADHRSDIYSLGCILYEMLVGEPPFIADSPMGVIYKHANEKQRSLALISQCTAVPESLDLIINKMMDKDPQRRYQSVLELQSELENRIAIDSSAETRPLEFAAKSANLKLVLLVVLVSFCGLCIPVVFLHKSPDKEQLRKHGFENDSQVRISGFERKTATLAREYEREEDKDRKYDIASRIVRDSLTMSRNYVMLHDLASADRVFKNYYLKFSGEVHGDPTQLSDLGSAYSDIGLYREAKEKFEKALSITEPDDNERKGYINCLRSALAIRLRDFAEAKTILQEALKNLGNASNSRDIKGSVIAKVAGKDSEDEIGYVNTRAKYVDKVAYDLRFGDKPYRFNAYGKLSSSNRLILLSMMNDICSYLLKNRGTGILHRNLAYVQEIIDQFPQSSHEFRQEASRACELSAAFAKKKGRMKSYEQFLEKAKDFD